ncbi:MAG: DUF6069 family protein [Candidatus Nanopelagicales bacterium]
MPSANPLPRDPRPHRRIRDSVRAGLVWGIAAAAVNIFIWLIARAFSVPTQVWSDPQGVGQLIDIGPLVIVGATLLASLLAGLATGVFARYVRQAVRWILAIGTLVLVASLTGPWQQPDSVPTSTRVVLTFMHVVTTLLVTFGLSRGIWGDDRAVVA